MTDQNVAKVASLYRQILNAGMVYSVDNTEFVSAKFDDIKNDLDNEVIYFYWTNDQGYEFYVTIDESGLAVAFIEDGDLVLMDTEGDPFRIRLFILQRVDPINDWNQTQNNKE